MNNEIHEIVFTDANNLSEEVIGFGADQTTAQRVFDWTKQSYLREGFIVFGNIQKPNFVEIIRRGGPSQCFIELRCRPHVDLKNMLLAIRLAALSVTDGKYLATGSVQGEVIRAEQLRQTAQYLVKEIKPKGTVLTHYLPGDRSDALKAFNALVQARAEAGETVRRNPGAAMKYSAMGADGLTAFEFIEVAQK
jgi:hypothetical protein